MQNPILSITTTTFKPGTLRMLVEKLAQLQSDIGYSLQEVDAGWEAIDTSTIESYVNGDINLSGISSDINIPFVACFVFTCSKSKESNYSFTWGSSLS